MPDDPILERGSVYFFYRPAVNIEDPEGLADVQRFYMVLNPRHDAFRILTIGRKRLPSPKEHGQFWGFVDAVTESASSLQDILSKETHTTETRGRQTSPAARPAGEGKYALFRAGDGTRFSYVLELPERRSSVQQALNIEREATFVVSVKNPEAGSPDYAGLSEARRASFPERLQRRFDGRRWIGVDPPEFLDREGAEFLFIGAFADAADEVEDALEIEEKSERTSEILQELRMKSAAHPVEPLFGGRWE